MTTVKRCIECSKRRSIQYGGTVIADVAPRMIWQLSKASTQRAVPRRCCTSQLRARCVDVVMMLMLMSLKCVFLSWNWSSKR